MLHACVQRQFSGRRPAVSVTVRSVVAVLGLFLLLPILSGVVGLESGYQAQAAPAFHAGGPDGFGYTFKDSNEPGGPVYAWEDISASGVLVSGWTGYDDGYAGPIPIGFTFNYYSVDYSELYIGTNGYVSFGQGYGTIPWGTLPQTGDPNNDIALFGGDMYLYDYGSVSKVYYQTLSNPTRFVVQFVNLYYCCSQNTPHTLQMILFPDGDIQAQYQMLNGTSTEYVGIENVTGTDGLSYGATLTDNLAIRYYYPVGVRLDPAQQTRFGTAGEVVTHQVRLTNRTGAADSFDLAVQPGHAWATTTSITRTGVLSDGASIHVQALVAIPSTAAPGDLDQATIMATSVTSPTTSHTALINTQATSGEIAYVTLSQSNLVVLVDAALHTVLGTVDVGAAGCVFPWRATIAPAGHQVYVSCYNSSSVTVIDTNSNAVVTMLAGIPSADGIAFTRDSEYALVGSRWNSQVTVIHTKDYTVSAIPTPGIPRSIATHPYLNMAYVTSGDGTLLVVDTDSFVILDSIYLFGNPWDVAVSPDGLWVFVSDRNGAGLAIINALDNTLYSMVTGVGVLTGLEVAPDGSKIYAASLWDGVRVIDGSTFQLITTVTGTGSAWELAATCNGDEIWVGNTSSAVPVIDANTNLVTQSVSMPGGQTKEIAICPQLAAEGVFLVPPNPTATGALGQAVTHQLIVVNASQATDSFTLTLSPSTWPAALSTTTVGPLNPGQTASFDVVVTIPPGAAWHASDTVQVTAASISDPNLSADANVTTIADSPPVISASPAALSSVQPVNQTVDQVLTISNGNGVTLTVEISDVDVTPGMLRVRPLDLPAATDLFPGSAGGSGDARPTAPAPQAPATIPRVLASGHEPSLRIQTGNVYSTTVDNENNALTGSPDYDMDTGVCDGYTIEPIEFNIFLDRIPGPTGNVLTVRAYDVDTPSEIDEVWLNGVYLGNLAGGDGMWSETTFSVPPGVVVMGANLVQVDIAGGGWCVEVDWGELFVAGRPAAWLHQSPSSVTVATNSSENVVVTFDSTGIQPGEYQGAIILQSNDPVQPYLSVPVTMTVQPTADMGRVSGTISDAWTNAALTARVELAGVHTTTANPDYQIWATAGAYSLIVSASGYVTVTVPVEITAGGVTVQDVALEPALARLEWQPLTVEARVSPGGQTMHTLVISNTGPMPLDLALFEINLDFNESAPRPEDLTGKRILYDRSHGQPAPGDYSTLINDAIAAGATIVENWYFPVDASVLQGYDILWSNCCGSITWGLGELLAVNSWMQRGGAVLVHGEDSPATAGLASIHDIFYFADNCFYGTTTNITPHPISAGVNSIYYYYSVCQRLSASPGSTIVVFDPGGRPNVVAKELNGGKMVVLAGSLFANWQISYADNHLLGNNTLGWLARPAYSDVPWLSFSPTSAVVPGHSTLPIEVQFDATALPTGVYHARMAIEHNDPNHVFPAEAPVTLTVEIPTAVKLDALANASQPAPIPLTTLPLAALPVTALAALGLAGWRNRQR
jgi:YVTN family beta-propeller protein